MFSSVNGVRERARGRIVEMLVRSGYIIICVCIYIYIYIYTHTEDISLFTNEGERTPIRKLLFLDAVHRVLVSLVLPSC